MYTFNKNEFLHQYVVIFVLTRTQYIDIIMNATNEILDLSIDAFMNQIPENAKKIEALEEAIDEMCKMLRSFHIARVQRGDCTIEMGFVFNDLLVNFERVSDHCSNIAFCVMHAVNVNAEGHEFAENVVTTESFRNYFEDYRKKYVAPLEAIHE